jgi:Holliday junction resolvasome RuvABC endonuclease subunit
MVARLLRLERAPSPSDAADGIAAALTCHMSAHLTRIASLQLGTKQAPIRA